MLYACSGQVENKKNELKFRVRLQTRRRHEHGSVDRDVAGAIDLMSVPNLAVRFPGAPSNSKKGVATVG